MIRGDKDAQRRPDPRAAGLHQPGVTSVQAKRAAQNPGAPIELPTSLASHQVNYEAELGGGQWCRGKSFDTFAPLGPVLVSPAELPDPNALAIGTELNGERVQDGYTSDMIFSVAEIIAFLSGSTTLLPGTVILTGTPHGVGMAADPPRWLQAGDLVSVTIEGIGKLTNPIIE